MKPILLYCYFRKFFKDSALDTGSLKKKLAEFKTKNTKLKETVTRQDKELLLSCQ